MRDAGINLMARKIRFITLSLLLLAAAVALSSTEARADTFNLTNFGAVGDGVTDDGPALQSALDALANAGGGTLIVPAGRYALITPVSKDFSGLASSVTILGVESTTPVYTKVTGNDLANGLDLTSEFYPKTTTHDAVHIWGLQSFLIKDIAFVGTPGIVTDARTTLVFTDVKEATIRHCEFYGLRTLIQDGAIVTARRSILKIEQSKFLGCTGNSGVNVPVIQNLEWKGLELTNTVFLDYGERPELYGKMDRAPLAWIRTGSAASITSDSPRRDIFIRDLFLDEGGWIGIYTQPGAGSAKVDLFYITDLTMNVSNLGMFGHYLLDLRGLLIEKSRYQWSHIAQAAIQLRTIDTAILDRLECVDSADRIAATSETVKLYVIDSSYTTLDSQAQETQVITTTDPEEDPVQYVRERYLAVLGSAPDPVGHFYWSDLILRCANDAQCISAKQADLNAYLATSPAPNFSIAGLVTDEDGLGVSGVAMTLSGSVQVATTTDADGHYSFNSLPTSGNYTLALSKTNYTFNPRNIVVSNPIGNTISNFTALNPGVPVLISEANSTRAIAFDAVLQTREPFPLGYTIPWASDRRTRIMLFATNFSLAANEDASAVTASAEAAGYAIYPLTVEYVGKVPGYEWLNCIVVRLWHGMDDVGDVLISIRYMGRNSNRVRLGIGHVGGGPPDDFGAMPTPGQAPE